MLKDQSDEPPAKRPRRAQFNGKNRCPTLKELRKNRREPLFTGPDDPRGQEKFAPNMTKFELYIRLNKTFDKALGQGVRNGLIQGAQAAELQRSALNENARAMNPNDCLQPVRNRKGRMPTHFPTSIGEFRDLTEDVIDEFVGFYGLSTEGVKQEKHARLAVHLQITLTLY